MRMVKLLWGKHLSYVFNTINYGVNCKHYKVPLVSIGHNQTIGDKLTDLPSCVTNIEQEAYGETPVNKDECTLYVSYYTENNNQASREGHKMKESRTSSRLCWNIPVSYFAYEI